ncbi:RICIN domain-containing protein, partial [Actinoplanes sp. NPDC051633]|uniref:RICIN domain-containing protein n=1 Tax=Actinoplanes sp. NPDC051633 TaxID=3155670 RepID=UPI003445FB8C
MEGASSCFEDIQTVRAGDAATRRCLSTARRLRRSGTTDRLGLLERPDAALHLRRRRHAPHRRQVRRRCDGSTQDMAAAQIYACNNTSAQRWAITSAGDIVNPQSGQRVDIGRWNAASGAPRRATDSPSRYDTEPDQLDFGRSRATRKSASSRNGRRSQVLSSNSEASPPASASDRNSAYPYPLPPPNPTAT